MKYLRKLILCGLGLAGLLRAEETDRLWEEYTEKLIRDIPKRGCNTKQDQENFFREQGKAVNLSQDFQISPCGTLPETLFLSGSSGYIIMKGIMNRSGLAADLIPFQYLASEFYQKGGSRLFELLNRKPYGLTVCIPDQYCSVKLTAAEEQQFRKKLESGLVWLEINPPRRALLIRKIFPEKEWKKPLYDAGGKTRLYWKQIGKGGIGVLKSEWRHSDADLFAIYQAMIHVTIRKRLPAAEAVDGLVHYDNPEKAGTAECRIEFLDPIRKKRFYSRQQVKLKKRGSFRPAVPDDMPFGKYLFKAEINSNGAGCPVGCAGEFSNMQDGAVTALDIPETVSRKNGRFQTGIRFKTDIPAGKLKFRLLTADGKRMPFSVEKTIPAGTGKTSLSLRVDYSFLAANIGYAEAEFMPEKGRKTIWRQLFRAPRSPQEQQRDYLQIMWGLPRWRNELDALIRSARQNGFNAVHTGYYFNRKRYEKDMEVFNRNGLPLFLEYIAEDGVFGRSSCRNGKHLFMHDLADPKFRARLEKNTRMRAEALRPYGICGYAANEEIGLGTDEVCFRPETQKKFGEWSLKKYGSLEKLNAAWGSSYKDQEEIRGIVSGDQIRRAPEKPAQWLDFRMFMEELYNSLMEKEFFGTLKQAVPGVAAGYNAGPYTDVPTQGLNAARLGRTITYSIEYQPGFLGRNLELSGFDMLAGRDVPFLYTVGGYPNHYQRTDANYDYRNWYTILHGGRGFAWYIMQDDSRYSKFSGRYRPRGEAAAIARTSYDLRHGMGKLILSGKPRIRAGIYYSRLSRYMASYLKLRYAADREALKKLEEAQAEAAAKDPGVLECRAAASQGIAVMELAVPYMKALMESCGERWKLVFEDQLLSGKLEKQYKIICLPAAIALSEAEIRAFTRFVDNGGILIADVMTGYYDQAGNPNPLRREVDRLFGIGRNYEIPAFTSQSIRLPDGKKATVVRGEQVSSNAPGITPKKKLLIGRRTGKGATLYLGGYFSENLLDGRRQPEIIPEIRCLIRSLAGNDSGLKIESDGKEIPGISGVEISDYRSGPVRFLVFQRKFNVRPENSPRLLFGRKYHVYDSRGKKYLGHLSEIPFPVPEEGRTAVMALLPYRIDAVELRPLGKNFRRGTKIQAAVSLKGTRNGIGAGHVAACRVYRPDGQEEFRMENNLLLTGGTGILELPILPDDPAGNWKIEAAEVLTGKRCSITIRIQ